MGVLEEAEDSHREEESKHPSRERTLRPPDIEGDLVRIGREGGIPSVKLHL